VNGVAFVQQKFGQIRTVLPGYAGNESGFHWILKQTPNTERRTSNAEVRASTNAQRSTLNVQRSMISSAKHRTARSDV
jgi:hypothetical protein